MPGLLADLMHPHWRHHSVHPHVHAALSARPETTDPATAGFRQATCAHSGRNHHFAVEQMISGRNHHFAVDQMISGRNNHFAVEHCSIGAA
jgi:hypothetical protein